MYRRRSIKTLSESRTSQISLLPTTTAVAPTTMHSNSNQCNQGQGEQYLPGQHWLADPGPGNLVVTGHGEQICAEQGFDTSNNNYLNMGAFGGSHLSPFGPNNGQMSCSSSNTIHHTGQQQLPSTSYTPSYRQGQHSMTLASSPQYFAGRSLNYNPGNTMNAHAPPPYLPSCNSYHPHPYRHHQHQIHGPNSAAGFSTSQTCHYHVGGHIVLGSATPAPTAAVASTSTAPRIKTRKNSAASSSALLLSRIPWRSSSEMFAYGGLSVLWRQVPEACQKIVTQHDIPDTVKVRGYFTVCELLELKRSLMGRLNNMEPEGHGILPPEDGMGVGVVVKQQVMDTLGNNGQPTTSLSAPKEGDSNKGFAFKTVGHRLPVILTKVIDQLSRDKNEIGDKLGMDARDEVKVVVGALAKLKNEMQTNKSMPKTNCHVWDTYLELMGQRYFEGKSDEIKWYLAPWLFVECYMYKRLNDAFQSTKFLKEYDVFKKQKETGWLQSIEAAVVLGKFVQSAEPTDAMLEEMLEISLWGNRCDLSISQGEDNSQTHNIVDQLETLKKFILCDDAPQFWQYLKEKISERPTLSSNTNTEISIGYVLDNAGFELFTDLCFADSLMSKVDRIDFHVKTMPWFVSDALHQDFNWLIDSMIHANNNPILVDFGKRWKGYLESNKWNVIESSFWTYPHAFHEMLFVDPNLFSTLQQNTVLIFKGDLNYRKLIGDINWLPETPFKEALQGFLPSPLLALRTLKADCVAGLRPGLAKEIHAQNPNWMLTGEYGIVQFCSSIL